MIEENKINNYISEALNKYFKDLDGEKPAPVYDMVINSVEKPVIQYVLQLANRNQSKASEILGINRNTLRKKSNSTKSKFKFHTIKYMKKVIISVSNKDGLIPFAKELINLKFDIYSTGGTYKLLTKNKVNATEISKYTEFPEMLDGRLKTLHPKIHGGILADLSKKKHVNDLKSHGIEIFSLVVVNLYPFIETIKKIVLLTKQ